MKMSPQGIDALCLFEGVVLKAYRDSVGVLTIGVGHTAAAGPPNPGIGMRITRQEALDILARDLGQYEAAVEKRMPQVPQWVFDGATSFCFNLGAGAIAKASWVAKYAAGDMAGAEASLRSWNKAGGRVLPGLTTRRRQEADMIFRNRYPDGRAFSLNNSAPKKTLHICGDSIAVGIAQQLGGATSDAKVGIGSAQIIARVRPADYLVVSAGSNDATDPTANLEAIRAKATGLVIWIIPANASRDAVKAAAFKHNDRTVSFVPGGDGVHPKSYQALANDVMHVIQEIEAKPMVSDQPVIPDGPMPTIPQPDDPGPVVDDTPEPEDGLPDEPLTDRSFFIAAGIIGGLLILTILKVAGVF